MARPSLYTNDLAERICELIATGTSVLQIGKLAGMPTERTIVSWRATREEFSRMYDEAKDRLADHFAAEIINIADNDPDPQRARNRIDARKWYAAKCAPRKYGDKLDVSGTVSVGRVYTDEERAAAMLLILKEGQVSLPGMVEGGGD